MSMHCNGVESPSAAKKGTTSDILCKATIYTIIGWGLLFKNNLCLVSTGRCWPSATGRCWPSATDEV